MGACCTKESKEHPIDLKEEYLDGMANADAIQLERSGQKHPKPQPEDTPDDILFKEKALEMKSHKSETNVGRSSKLVGNKGSPRSLQLRKCAMGWSAACVERSSDVT